LRFWRSAASGLTTRQLYLYDDIGTLLGTTVATVEGSSFEGWVSANFTTPINVVPGQKVLPSYDEPGWVVYHLAAPTVVNAAHATYVEGRYGAIGAYPYNAQAGVTYYADLTLLGGGGAWPLAVPGDNPVVWTDISGKPSTFPPSAHGHPFTDITGTLTDAQHGSRGGGALPAAATAAAAGFMVDAASDGNQRSQNVLAASVGTPAVIAKKAPIAQPGQLWYERHRQYHIFYNDGNTSRWVRRASPPCRSRALQSTPLTLARGQVRANIWGHALVFPQKDHQRRFRHLAARRRRPQVVAF
jgi:hypothetical protein